MKYTGLTVKCLNLDDVYAILLHASWPWSIIYGGHDYYKHWWVSCSHYFKSFTVITMTCLTVTLSDLPL